MADESKNKAALDAKAADAAADAPKASEAKSSPAAHEASAPDVGKLSPADVQLIGHVAAQVVSQQNALAGRAPSRVMGSDSTVRGGKYMVDGVAVNAWGEPYQEGKDGTLSDPERRHF